MPVLVFITLLLTIAGGVSAQGPEYRDSVKNAWKKSFRKVFFMKATTDSTYDDFAFSKSTHELLAVTSYPKYDEVPSILNQEHFYFHNNQLVWIRVWVHYPPNKKEKGMIELFFYEGKLVDSHSEGKIIADYSYLKHKAEALFENAKKLIAKGS